MATDVSGNVVPSPEQDAHRKWKHLAAPMYDWMTNHHLVWPGLACRFGSRQAVDSSKYTQYIYYSDQVGGDDKATNKLVKQGVDVPEEGYCPMDHINTWKENQKSPYFSKTRHIINHPGECNKIMEIKQADNVVVTHSDCEEVFVWCFDRQPNHAVSAGQKHKKTQRSVPDVRLTGHTAPAPFALSCSSASPSVASGAEDKAVCIWNLEDHAGGALLRSSSAARGSSAGAGETLAARTTLSGHDKTITGVAFQPGSDQRLISTSDDHVIKLWDTRQQDATESVPQAAAGDVLCLDWASSGDMVATGADGGKVHVYDVRKLAGADGVGAPLLEFDQFTRNMSSVLSVAWNPLKPSWLLSAGNDGRVSVFDTARPAAASIDGLPSQLIMQHIGHLGNIMDAQWSPFEEHMVMSVSNDGETYKDGGAIQLWRLSWLLYADFDVAEKKLQKHQKWLESGKLSDLPAEGINPPAPAGTPAAAAGAPQAPAKEAAPAAAAVSADKVATPASAPEAEAATAATGSGGEAGEAAADVDMADA